MKPYILSSLPLFTLSEKAQLPISFNAEQLL